MRRAGRWAVVLLALIAWYAGLGSVDTWAQSTFDVADPATAARMGSTAVAFPYALGVAVASALPPLLVSVWVSWRRQIAAIAGAAIVALVVSVAAAFHLSGAAVGCDTLRPTGGTDAFFIAHVALLVVITGVSSASAYRRGGVAGAGAMVLGLTTVSSFLGFMLEGHCHNSAGMPSGVGRDPLRAAVVRCCR